MPNFVYHEMLEIKTPFNPTDNQLNTLAEWMANQSHFHDSKIPAGYTYLSQFIDHDISLDSLSGTMPWSDLRPFGVKNNRTPFFDLETVYGADFSSGADIFEPGSNSYLRIGTTEEDIIRPAFQNDLPRSPNSSKAQIIDNRNDENLAVAQTQVAFMRFHNAIVKYLKKPDTKDTFLEARRIAIRHYQWIILKDFLPRIVKNTVLEDVLKNGNRLYSPTSNNVFMPLEFSVAAYRMGHSMVRNKYNWNGVFKKDKDDFRASIKKLKLFTGSSCQQGYPCMEGGDKLPSRWIINWNWFFDINDSMNLEKASFNFAQKINTKISSLLGRLAYKSQNSYFREYSLPAFDLYRARFMSLPTGQAVANQIDPAQILDSKKIANLLPKELKDSFSGETPIWFYLLAEAELNEDGETLGEVGSRIVTEVFIELLKRSAFSVLGIVFPDDKDFLNEFADINGEFGMPQMLDFIEKIEPGFINPLG